MHNYPNYYDYVTTDITHLIMVLIGLTICLIGSGLWIYIRKHWQCAIPEPISWFLQISGLLIMIGFGIKF